MNGRSRNSKGEVQETKKAKTQNRLCDLCGEKSKAILYCRADTAKLCLNCDYQVHSTYQLFTKHTRYLLCDSCDSSPCSIFCSNHDLVLCQHCDWEKHGSVSLLHNRRPLDGFTGCPSVTELLASFGIEDLGQERKRDCGFDDDLIWDTPSMLGLDDWFVSDGFNHNFVATGIPDLPKNRNSVCGQHKEEIICQLRQMAKLEPNFDDNIQYDKIVASSGFHDSLAFKDNGLQKDPNFDLEQNVQATYFPSYAATTFKSLSAGTDEGACKVPGEKSNIGQSLQQRNNGHKARVGKKISPKVITAHEMSSQERQDALARYKEKKKCRRYEHQIRYEERKIVAENRARIRGRFARKYH
ncbi:zinc finger protein CONSTANS-LIKE 13-like [Apium graveolens]|uniref:zinc finger protein CONSTANS-LIKE 13-like n=1 Tax=Apium graveolens TaxID=4045 RepID=UPI003D790B3E